MNEICNGCLTWDKLKEKCPVFWEGKSWCTLKVTSFAEMQQQNMLLGPG